MITYAVRGLEIGYNNGTMSELKPTFYVRLWIELLIQERTIHGVSKIITIHTIHVVTRRCTGLPRTYRATTGVTSALRSHCINAVKVQFIQRDNQSSGSNSQRLETHCGIDSPYLYCICVHFVYLTRNCFPFKPIYGPLSCFGQQ